MTRAQKLSRKNKLLGWLRDKAYDAVFHVGDTALQFTADLIRGPHNNRQHAYLGWMASRNNRQAETPLTQNERTIFTEIVSRQPYERPIDFWRRRNALLANPAKKEIIAEYAGLKQQREKLNKKQVDGNQARAIKKLEEQFRAIRSLHHARSDRARHSHRMRMR